MRSSPGTPVKCSVAAIVRHPTDESAFLVVRRPPDDDALPLVWGLPAVSLKQGELPEAALRRLGREKLGVELAPRSFVGIQAAERPGYQLILMDLEAELLEGTPSISDRTLISAATSAASSTRGARIEKPGGSDGVGGVSSI